MKIFFIGYDLNRYNGGMQHYYLTILDYLSRKGHSLYTYTYIDGPSVTSSTRQIRKIEFIDRHFRGMLAHLAVILKIKKIEHVFCGHMFLTPIADKLCRVLKLDYTLFTHGTECWAGYFRKDAQNQKCLTRIVTVSDFTKKQLMTQGAPADKIVYIPCVIDPERYIPRHVKKDKNKFIILTVCRHEKEQGYKGCDEVIRAMPTVLLQVPQAEYWITGKGDDLPRLERLVDEYNLRGKVRFLGFLPFDELVNVYASSDIFVMPSRLSLDEGKMEGEGFGVVFLEAGVMGKPLIGPNRGGSLDIIRDGYNGFNVNPTDRAEIAERIVRLARDADLRKTMGENARQVVLKEYTISHLSEYIQPLFA